MSGRDLLARLWASTAWSKSPPREKEMGEWFRGQQNRWPEGFNHPWSRKLVLDEMLADTQSQVEPLQAQTATEIKLKSAMLDLIEVVREINRP